jgi:solute carrier family 13 (sodium-dependent dicarboxylate transporter), member 2/3/5
LNLKKIGLIVGPLLCFLACLEPSPLVSSDAWKVIGLAAWIVVWWISEAIPIGMTSLLPIVYLSLSGVSTLSEACTPYGSPIVFLFLGGFILAISLEKWRIHERVALKILAFTGTSANGVIFGFMSATALLSMWMSNTATTLMMLPIALSVLALLRKGAINEQRQTSEQQGMKNFGIAMMLAVAYGANIGGTMTLIGTPPNLVLASFLNRDSAAGEASLSFLDWLMLGVPFGLVALTFTYLMLIYVLYPNRLGEVEGAKEVIDEARTTLGEWTPAQKRVSAVFLCTALCWVFRAQLSGLLNIKGLSDAAVGLIGAMILFMMPSGQSSRTDGQIEFKPLLVWDDMKRLPWDIVLLFGGGLSLAQALKQVGLIQAIGDQFSNLTSVTWMSLAMLTLIALMLTEVMSNVALVSVFIPVVSAVAIGLNLPPIALCAPVTLAASCAFMLPMSTPPNAIVFASGHVQISHMVKAGIFLNLIAVLWITTLARWFYF